MLSGKSSAVTEKPEEDKTAFTKQRKEQIKQLDSLHKMYKTCLLSQSNFARMYAGAAQGKNRPATGGLRLAWQTSDVYRDQFFHLENSCEQYKQQQDELFKQLYSGTMKKS